MTTAGPEQQKRSQVFAVISTAGIFLLEVVALKAVRISPLGAWEMDVFGRPLVSYLCAGMVLLILLRYGRGRLGVDVPVNKDLKGQVSAAAVGFLPVGAVALSLNFVEWRDWPGAGLVTGLIAGCLLVVGWLLRGEGQPKEAQPEQPFWAGWVLLGQLLISTVFVASFTGLGRMAQSFLFNFCIVAPVEEMLFRGVIQARLNMAFGCPFRTFGTAWGWGLVISAGFFSLWHVVSPINPVTGQLGPALPWGLWTLAAGLLFGFLRERTGGLAAPVILHGVLNFL